MKKKLYIQMMEDLRRKVDAKIRAKFKQKKEKRCVVCSKVIQRKKQAKYCLVCSKEMERKQKIKGQLKYAKTEKGKKSSKKYRQKPENIEKKRQYYLNNKEKIDKKAKEWREKNRERFNAKRREYSAKRNAFTPENVKRSCDAKRVIMKGYGYEGLAEDIKQEHTILYKRLQQKEKIIKLKETISKLKLNKTKRRFRNEK